MMTSRNRQHLHSKSINPGSQFVTNYLQWHKNIYSDAQHIAIATTLKVDSLVSWNFKHMVNFFRIRQYNSINLKFGYSTIDIRTPKEVIYEDKN